MGTPDFSIPCLEILHQHPNINLVSVISMPDRPSGRGQELKSPEVIEYSKNNNIPFFQTQNINKEENFIHQLESQGIDLIIVLAFAQFLGDKILALPKLGCFNIHTSLLPKYRGAAPIQYALWNNDQSTGACIQKMVKKMDAGDIAIEKEITISPDETGGSLSAKLRLLAGEALKDFLDQLLKNKINYKKQDESKVTFAPTLKKHDGFLDFKQMTILEITNRIKAMDPWPGTFCFLNSKRLKVFSIEKINQTITPGRAETNFGFLAVGCKDGSLRLKEVQLEGKKRCTDTELLNGLRGPIELTDYPGENV